MRFSSVAVALSALVAVAVGQGGAPDAYGPGWNDNPAGPDPVPEFTNNIGQCQQMLIAWSGSSGDVSITIGGSQGNYPTIIVHPPATSTVWTANLPENANFYWELTDSTGTQHGEGPGPNLDNHFTVTSGTTDCMSDTTLPQPTPV